MQRERKKEKEKERKHSKKPHTLLSGGIMEPSAKLTRLLFVLFH